MTGVRTAGGPPLARGLRAVGATMLGVSLALAAGILVVLAPATPAAAHATLVTATPAPGAVVGTSPTEVVVTFSESVTPVTGKIHVLAPDGTRISGTPTARGPVLRIPVRRADRPLGTYLVSYRVIAADSHPVGGGLTFSVGAPSASPPEPPQDSVHPSVAVALPVARYVGYAGLVLAVGPTLLLALLWPRRSSRRGAVRLVYTGLAMVALATVAALWAQEPYNSGAPVWQVSGTGLAAVLGSTLGVALTARLALLAVIAALLPPVLRARVGRAGRRRASPGPADHEHNGRGPTPADHEHNGRGPTPADHEHNGRGPGPAGDRHAGRGPAGRGRAALLVALAVGALVTWPVAGHAAAAPIPPVAVAADVVHLAAMAVWLGGLVTLAAFLLRSFPGPYRGAESGPVQRAHVRALAVILPAWSRWAALAVVWLVGGGTVQAVMQVGSVSSLMTTGYGRLLLAKVAVLVPVLAAAAYARRLVQRTASASAGIAGLRRTVAVEVVATAVVLGLSAVLVQATPARNATAERLAEATDGVSQTLTSRLFTLQFNIYPVQLGENNTVHAFVYTPEGSPLPAAEWTVTTMLTSHGAEPVRTRMLGLQPPHHALGALTFPLPGVYELRFTVRTSDIDQATVRTTVTVR